MIQEHGRNELCKLMLINSGLKVLIAIEILTTENLKKNKKILLKFIKVENTSSK
jgi:hypothetical protein